MTGAISENHACKRARERYGADLTTDDLVAMRRMIRFGQCHVEYRLRDGTQRIVVLYKKRAFFVVYCPQREVILTFMPRGWTDNPPREKSRADYARAKRRAGEKMR